MNTRHQLPLRLLYSGAGAQMHLRKPNEMKESKRKKQQEHGADTTKAAGAHLAQAQDGRASANDTAWPVGTSSPLLWLRPADTDTLLPTGPAICKNVGTVVPSLLVAFAASH